MQVYAPAKINLSLEIKSRRADGFHDIETLMVPISLADRLTIGRKGTDNRIRFACNDPTLPSGEENLVVRAANLFQQTTKISAGIEIALEKKIPHGAGLGGGSSDAAATLIGLNTLFDTRLSEGSLTELAAEIGSDVPFFVIGSAAICRGRGEIVEVAKMPARFTVLLVKPSFGVPTPWAYARWRNSRELPGLDYATQAFAGSRFVNDLERPVFEKFLFLGYLKTWLRRQPEVSVALLSGSGSTVFAILREGVEAERLAARVREEIDPKIWTHVCTTDGGVFAARSGNRQD